MLVDATRKRNLMTNIESVHEGVIYPCDQCEFKATKKANLLTHFKSKHKGVILIAYKGNKVLS